MYRVISVALSGLCPRPSHTHSCKLVSLLRLSLPSAPGGSSDGVAYSPKGDYGFEVLLFTNTLVILESTTYVVVAGMGSPSMVREGGAMTGVLLPGGGLT